MIRFKKRKSLRNNKNNKTLFILNNLIIKMSENESVHKKQILYLNDKSKDRQKVSTFAVKRINLSENISNRKDAYGSLINHKNKRNVKVTFKDKIENSGSLTEIINVESFKKYNYMENYSNLSEREVFLKERTVCSCNII